MRLELKRGGRKLGSWEGIEAGCSLKLMFSVGLIGEFGGGSSIRLALALRTERVD